MCRKLTNAGIRVSPFLKEETEYVNGSMALGCPNYNSESENELELS